MTFLDVLQALVILATLKFLEIRAIIVGSKSIKDRFDLLLHTNKRCRWQLNQNPALDSS